MPVPIHTRKKMIPAVERGESIISVARRFEVCLRMFHNIITHYRERDHLEHLKPGPKGSNKLMPADDMIMIELIQQYPGITLREIIPRLTVEIVESTVCRRLKKLGYTLKKH